MWKISGTFKASIKFTVENGLIVRYRLFEDSDRGSAIPKA